MLMLTHVMIVLSMLSQLYAADEASFDKTIRGLFCEQMMKEKLTIEKNKVILKRIEGDLEEKVRNGMLEQELCIRNGISALKTVDYSYNSIIWNITAHGCSEFRLRTFDELKRIQDVKRLFFNVNMKIEECLLKYAVSAKKELGNEIIKDEVIKKQELIKTDISVPEAFPAARSPFR